MEIRDNNLVKWLERMKMSPFWRDKIKYYRFHSDHRHDTIHYRMLKDKIEFFYKEGAPRAIMMPKHNA